MNSFTKSPILTSQKPFNMMLDLHHKDFYILLENTKSESDDAWLFENPVAEIVCRKGDELLACFAQMDTLRRSGHYLCGYVSYEAGYYLVDKDAFTYTASPNETSILLHMYAFESVKRIAQSSVNHYFSTLPQYPVKLRHITFGLTQEMYEKQFAIIQQNIKDGNTYQINFTTHFKFDVDGSDLALYQALRSRQKVEFGAYLKFPEASILSISPELFFRKQDQLIESKPMKGTFARKLDPIEDQAVIDYMKQDEKTLSENVMIVDLIRNDISRITEKGSVSVKNLFEIQSYETVHQMISTVRGKVVKDLSVTEIFSNLFPCGSITGAPKISTMEIIEQIESAPRGIYTGAIGYITPDNDMCFNVPIRTVVLDHNGKGELGVGGGIIADSECYDEYEECLLKAKFLTGLQTFQLIESMRYDHQQRSLLRLEQHLARLAKSAKHFDFMLKVEELRLQLTKAVADIEAQDAKVRVLLHRNGEMNIDISTLIEDEAPKFIQLSDYRMNSHDVLLQHKTTLRTSYEQAYQQGEMMGWYDVLFMNEHGEITECSRHNVFIQKGEQWFTPSIESGLLGGTRRAELIQTLGSLCVETKLYWQDLQSADHIWLTNSVRGLVKVQLSQVDE